MLLHDLVEVVGVVSKAPQVASLHMGRPAGEGCGSHCGAAGPGDDAMMEADVMASHPPSSQVRGVAVRKRAGLRLILWV